MTETTYRVEIQMSVGDDWTLVTEMPGASPLDVMRTFSLAGYADVDAVSVCRYVDGVQQPGKVATFDLDDLVWRYADAEWTFAPESPESPRGGNAESEWFQEAAWYAESLAVEHAFQMDGGF